MEEKKSHQKARSESFGMQIWRFFSSLRLALVLILILSGLSLIGTFVIQAPLWATSNPNSYNQWLEYVARPQTGFWYPILHLFDFFNVFHSAWFIAVGGLLIISIIVCSLNRLRRVRINISSSKVNRSEKFYKTNSSQQVSCGTHNSAEAGNLISGLLKKRRYSVTQENASEGLYLVADKNRFSPLGTYVIHLSLILLLVGYLMGSYMGFKDTSFIVPEGATKSIGYNTGLSLHLNSFTDEYWPDGLPKDYRSNVDVIKNNQVVQSAVIRVNHPLVYQGVRVYQSFFGPAAQIKVTDANGQDLYNGTVALSGVDTSQSYQRPSGALSLGQNGYILYIFGRAVNLADPELNKGQVGFELFKTGSNTPIASTKLDQGVPYKAGDFQVTYLGSSEFSGFEISRDPGINLIWIAAGLFLLGLTIVFYFPRRRIWAFIESSPDQMNRLWLRHDSGRKPGVVPEFQSLIKEIKRKLILSEKETR